MTVAGAPRPLAPTSSVINQCSLELGDSSRKVDSRSSTFDGIESECIEEVLSSLLVRGESGRERAQPAVRLVAAKEVTRL